jgi:tRNA (guanine-N(7)-)-methyltransferase
MRRAAGVVLKRMIENISPQKIDWDLKHLQTQKFEAFWNERLKNIIPTHIFESKKPVWLEVGAGSGWFFIDLAKKNPHIDFIAIERSRMRGHRLVSRTKKAELTNLASFRCNAIPTLIHNIPTESVDRIYFMYPCPWPKNAQRKNRWYLHPVMPHIFRILKKGGMIIWASDQKFYIDEAHYVCEKFGLKTLIHGEISPNPYNHFEAESGGRTRFENLFMSQKLPCYELIVTKS